MEMSLPCKCHSRFWQREPHASALIVLIDVICSVACSRRRVNKAAVKRHGMSQRSFIRSFHLFVRSFILSFFFISFVRIGRSFILFTMSFVHFVRSCRLFVHASRSFRLFALASFIYSFTFQSFRGRFLFSSFLSELFILSLENICRCRRRRTANFQLPSDNPKRVSQRAKCIFAITLL